MQLCISYFVHMFFCGNPFRLGLGYWSCDSRSVHGVAPLHFVLLALEKRWRWQVCIILRVCHAELVKTVSDTLVSCCQTICCQLNCSLTKHFFSRVHSVFCHSWRCCGQISASGTYMGLFYTIKRATQGYR